MTRPTHRCAFLLITCLLAATSRGQGTTPAQPKPAEAPAATPAPEDAADLIAKSVFQTITLSLMESVYKEHPDRIAPLIAEVNKAIDKECADRPGAKAQARTVLAMLLFNSAKAYFLGEFESIEADPGAMTEEQFTLLRLCAALTYLADNRHEAATKQFDKIAAEPTTSKQMLAVTWAWRAMMARDRAECSESCEKLREFMGTTGDEFPWLMARMARLRWCENAPCRDDVIEEILEKSKTTKNPRTAAAVTAMAVGMSSTKDAATKAALPDSAAERLQSTPITDAKERLFDLLVITALLKEPSPEKCLRLATQAEDFARKNFAANSEELRLARLIRAKALRDAGKKDEMAAYADIDVEEELTAGFGFSTCFDGDCPGITLESHVRKAEKENDP